MLNTTATIRVIPRKTKKIVELTIFIDNNVIIKVWENLSYRVIGSFFHKDYLDSLGLLEKEDNMLYELTLLDSDKELFELRFRTESFSKNPTNILIGKFSASQ